MTLLALLSALIPAAHAAVIDTAGIDDGPGVASMWATICSTLPFCDVGSTAPSFLLDKITTFVFSLIVGVGIIVIIYSGLRLVSSLGDEGRIAESKKTIMFAVGGILLAIMARAIVLFIGQTLLPGIIGG